MNRPRPSGEPRVHARRSPRPQARERDKPPERVRVKRRAAIPYERVAFDVTSEGTATPRWVTTETWPGPQ